MQFSLDVRNARLDKIQEIVGDLPLLQIRTGPLPKNCAAASSGSTLATLRLPFYWMRPADNGIKTKTNDWKSAIAEATGIAEHFRIYDGGGVVCHLQGTVGTSNADLIVENENLTQGQRFTIMSFELREGNA